MTDSASEPGLDFDAVIVGAGFSGLYMLYRLRDLLGYQSGSSRRVTA
jgi:monoamine oxidase